MNYKKLDELVNKAKAHNLNVDLVLVIADEFNRIYGDPEKAVQATIDLMND